jgi:phage terminase large subunit GpA-like protein
MDYQENMQKVLSQVQNLWKPPTELKISEWADEYRYLSPESSAVSGKYRTDYAPYQKEIMDVFNDPNIERVVWQKSAQVGATEILNNVIGYYIHMQPSPILVMQPTLQMAQAYSKEKLANMLRDTPVLRAKINEPKSKDSSNTVLSKKFEGGTTLNMVGSNSAASVASRAVRILCIDEVDRMEASVGSEGDPVLLASKRTQTFFNKKIYLCSTPTVKGISRIEAAFEESDQRYYYVPCPECNHKQTLKWSNVVWEENKPETAIYTCENGCVIDESKKYWMLKNGEWKATKETKKVAGFHLNELYSVFSTWGSMAENFLEAKKQPEMLKTFINTSLAETWEPEPEEAVEAEGLMARRESYDMETIPDEALVLTCGADIQKNRIEAQVVAYSHDYEMWVVDYKIIYGNTGQIQVWNDFDKYLQTKFSTHSGRNMTIACTTIDSGFQTQMVYAFTKNKKGRRIFAIKGQSQSGKSVVGKPTKVGKENSILYPVGSDTAKEVIYSRLASEYGYSTLHFPSTVDEEYFKQLTAEQRFVKFVKGRKTLYWKQIRERNEALDTICYSLAACYILNPNFNLIEQRLLTGNAPEPDKNRADPNKPSRKGINRGNFATSWK